MFDETIKKRLIGAIVLIAIAVIFFPMLFDVHHSEGLLDVAEIPEQPIFEKISFEVAQTPLNDEALALLKSQEILPTQDRSEEELMQQETQILKISQISSDKGKFAANDSLREEGVESDTQTKQSLALLDESGIPKIWSLQVATFGEKTNANVLQGKLRKLGYKAYVRKHDKQSLFKVYVGPQLDVDKMRQAQINIKKEFGLKGIVVRYVP